MRRARRRQRREAGVQCSAVRGDKKAERLRNKQEMERRCRQMAEASDRSGKRTLRLLGGCRSSPFSPSR
jgi:hypothetical protein